MCNKLARSIANQIRNFIFVFKILSPNMHKKYLVSTRVLNITGCK